MQYSWLGIALMTGVLVVGLIVGRVLSKDAIQKRASLFAFISLFLALAAFCVSVIMYSQTWAIPLFIIASMLVPIAVYGITASLVAKKDSEHVADEKSAKGKKSLPAQPLVGQGVSDVPAQSRVRDGVAEVRSAGLRDVPAGDRPAAEVCLPDAAPFEPSVPVPATQPVTLTFESCHAKAQALKEKGVHPVAARLFEESSRLTKNPVEARKALLDAVNCHVKANNLKEAKRIAVALQDNCETLGPVEALKLNLVLRAD